MPSQVELFREIVGIIPWLKYLSRSITMAGYYVAIYIYLYLYLLYIYKNIIGIYTVYFHLHYFTYFPKIESSFFHVFFPMKKGCMGPAFRLQARDLLKGLICDPEANVSWTGRKWKKLR